MNNKPTFISRDNMSSDEGYLQWISDIKQRFRQSQIKAAVRVNTTMLEFYWSVGRDLVALRAEERWGAGVVKQFALDMRQAFPNDKGFSDSNVKYMKQWYSFYYEDVTKSHQAGGQFGLMTKSQQLAGQLEATNRQQSADEIGHRLGDELMSVKRHQLGDELEMPEIFGRIPWKHHVLIFSKCHSVDEALFYITRVVEEGWSRSRLEDQVAANLYASQPLLNGR